MSTRVSPLTLSAIEQLPAHARRCVFWEIDPTASPDLQHFADPEFEKEAWLSMVLLEWGSCGQIATIGDKAAGCALYAPPGMVPRSQAFPTAPVSADAILLTSMRTEPHAADLNVGADLVRGVVADLVRRNVRAIEAFGIRHGTDAEAGDVPHATAALGCSDTECMIDADFLEDMGFEVVAPHHRYPRLRLELDRDHEWKIAVEAALDRLLEESSLTIADLTAGSPVGAH